MTALEPGMPAPDFTLLNQRGESVSLSDFAGKKLVLWFYPEALTPACQGQACDFRDHHASLRESGFEVVGVSRDSVEKLAKAAAEDGIAYDLVSDADKKVHEAYGVWGEKSMYGRTVIGVKRSTFVIDEHGKVEHVFYNTRAKNHLAMLDKRLSFTAG
ncbi:thioredoxin-dependent thiol peroxidase [uncultured Agrococcus sp.]|uniref:thioredoxin-dependent thiol peroxidase n=1 Tax=uncultured Agrococcus sp. TaxID=382258 RepID=UPI0025F3C35E|nr:thioredoxin-dependent thiol peroxidase [uncultured Agrococcus sp.]